METYRGRFQAVQCSLTSQMLYLGAEVTQICIIHEVYTFVT